MDVNTPENKAEELKTNVEVTEPEQTVTKTEKSVSWDDYQKLLSTNERLLEESKRNKLKKQHLKSLAFVSKNLTGDY